MPPSQALFFWKTCSSTRGWRPSCNSVSRAWLKYASVYQPARIFSTGRSKISGFSRVRVSVRTVLELEARGERGLGDLELLGRRLCGREPMLELVARLRQRLRHGVAGVARHPAEDLRRRGERAELGRAASMVADVRGRETGKRISHRRRHHERADEMTAAALVLLLRRVAVLVAPD